MFRPPRDRDAYAAIRGYVYQIDQTVLRWLDLAAGQGLELERGEDIDLVGRMIMPGGGVTEKRLLEQIKHREGGITLRTPAAQEALANFHDHRRHNPGIDLRFCFVTNAAAGREQLSIFPGGVPGITLWGQVCGGRLADPETAAALELLLRFLANCPRPDGFAEPVWMSWKEYLAATRPVEFRAFVERFEWSVGRPDAEELRSEITTRILALDFARDSPAAEAVADRLFVHVSRLLATAGLKRLTAADRTPLLAAPPLPPADRALLALLRGVVAEHSDRLDAIEVGVAALGSQVEALFLSGADADRAELVSPSPNLSPPTPVARLSPRRQMTAGLSEVLDSVGWLALHGGPDVGKTQLAVQIAAARIGPVGWVRFHHSQQPWYAGRQLDAAVAAVAGWDRPPPRGNWYRDALAKASPGTLLVLDDLPRVPGDAPFAEQLIRFGQAAQAAGVRALSTSQFEFPARVRHHFGAGLANRTTPPLTDGEAGELFRAHGAPDSFLGGRRLSFLNGQAAGHPLLLAATAEFLAARQWRYREEELDALLRGDHTAAVLPEVIDRLTRTLGDPSQQLLYRLTLPSGSFDRHDLLTLAGVQPAVDRPQEQFNDLLGAWVQRDTEARFTVSPLAQPLGQSELTPAIRAGCYRALAESITRRGTMNLGDGERAIAYNLQAGEPGRALTLYVVFLVEVSKVGRADHLVPVIDKWRETVLPAELSVGNRLMVRSYQLAAFTRYKLDTRFLVRDIDDLLAEATDRDGWGIVALAVQNLRRFRTKDPARVIGYIRRAIELPAVYGPDGRQIVFEQLSLPNMLWMLVTALRTPALLGAWLDAVENLPAQHRAGFWAFDAARQGVWLVANKVYTSEWEKPKPQQDWDGLYRALGELLVRARRLGQPRLEAALTGVMIEILGERKRTEEIRVVAEATLSRWAADPDVQFKVRGAWGRVCAYMHQPDVALPLLAAALSHTGGTDHERLRCLLAANICVGPGDLGYAEQARDLATRSADAPDLEAARALGEYALSVYQRQGGQAGAAASSRAWSGAMRRFFAAPRKDKFWRDLFPLFAHATTFLAQLAREGHAPEQTAEGERFVAPARGFLLRDYMPEREALYQNGGEASVALLMWSYAAAAGVGEEAAHWMRTLIEESRRADTPFILCAAGPDAVAEVLADGRFEDAVEVGIFTGRGMVVSHAAGPKDRATFEGRGVDLRGEYRKLPEAQRRLGDQYALISGPLPAAVALVRLALAGPGRAVSAGRRVAALCRQQAEDEWGDQELWRTAAELFELSSAVSANAGRIIQCGRAVGGDGVGATSLRVLGYVLGTWHATPEQAIAYHLSVIEPLFRWYPAAGGVRRRLLTPYLTEFWQRAARSQRFAFRAPDLTAAAIESAAGGPEPDRVRAVLAAAAGGFRIRGAHEVLDRLRAPSSG